MVAAKVGDANPADEIGRAVYAAERVEDLARAVQVVDEDHSLRAIRAEVVADRWTLPVDLKDAGILGIEHALAVAQAGKKGPAGFLAEDVAIRPAGALEGVFDDLGKVVRDAAKEAVPHAFDLVHGKGAVALGWRCHVRPTATACCGSRLVEPPRVALIRWRRRPYSSGRSLRTGVCPLLPIRLGGDHHRPACLSELDWGSGRALVVRQGRAARCGQQTCR